MNEGNWIAMDKALLDALPKKRQYTLIEAAFSHQVDLFSGKTKSYRGYAKIWGWSVTKTVYFLKNAQSTKTETAKDTHNTVKFRFIKPPDKSKEHAGKKARITAENTPNKHNKDNINTKPIRDGLKSIGNTPNTGKAMSLSEYSKITPVDHMTKTAIEYFLSAYRTHRKEEHPNLKGGQWKTVIRMLFTCLDEKTGEGFDLSLDELQRMIDKYFTTDFRQGCNYSIIHFNNNGIKIRRMYETTNDA